MSGKRFYSERWNVHETREFIETRIRYNYLFVDRVCNARTAWEKIGNAPGARFPHLHWKKLRKKWTNLLEKYKRTHQKLKDGADDEPGNWHHYQILHEFCSLNGMSTSGTFIRSYERPKLVTALGRHLVPLPVSSETATATAYSSPSRVTLKKDVTIKEVRSHEGNSTDYCPPNSSEDDTSVEVHYRRIVYSPPAPDADPVAEDMKKEVLDTETVCLSPTAKAIKKDSPATAALASEMEMEKSASNGRNDLNSDAVYVVSQNDSDDEMLDNYIVYSPQAAMRKDSINEDETELTRLDNDITARERSRSRTPSLLSKREKPNPFLEEHRKTQKRIRKACDVIIKFMAVKYGIHPDTDSD